MATAASKQRRDLFIVHDEQLAILEFTYNSAHVNDRFHSPRLDHKDMVQVVQDHMTSSFLYWSSATNSADLSEALLLDHKDMGRRDPQQGQKKQHRSVTNNAWSSYTPMRCSSRKYV